MARLHATASPDMSRSPKERSFEEQRVDARMEQMAAQTLTPRTQNGGAAVQVRASIAPPSSTGDSYQKVASASAALPNAASGAAPNDNAVPSGVWGAPGLAFPVPKYCCGWRCCCEVYTWRSRLNFILMLLIELASEASRGLTLPTMYLYVRDMGGDLGTLASLVSTFSLGRMIASPLLGIMAERHTYALGFAMSIAISIAGNILWCACANSKLPMMQRFVILFVSRFITGFGAGNRSICRAFTVRMVHHSDRLTCVLCVNARQRSHECLWSPVCSLLFSLSLSLSLSLCVCVSLSLSCTLTFKASSHPVFIFIFIFPFVFM